MIDGLPFALGLNVSVAYLLTILWASPWSAKGMFSNLLSSNDSLNRFMLSESCRERFAFWSSEILAFVSSIYLPVPCYRLNCHELILLFVLTHGTLHSNLLAIFSHPHPIRLFLKSLTIGIWKWMITRSMKLKKIICFSYSLQISFSMSLSDSSFG